MRLGLLGPAAGDVAALGRAAEFLLNTAKVNRAIYLGIDGTLDRAVSAWARKLVGDDPSDDAAWTRAAEIALSGTPGTIDHFVSTERSRLRLKALETLPEGSRTIEMLGDRVAVLIYDKADLDEEDILGASILLYGKNEGPLAKKIGSRWFVSPGKLGAGGGIGVVAEEGDDIVATLYDPSGKVGTREALQFERTAKLKVQGGP